MIAVRREQQNRTKQLKKEQVYESKNKLDQFSFNPNGSGNRKLEFFPGKTVVQ